ncbi:MAG: type II secretion system F family protein [Pseudobdellovibrio sp.]
MAKFQYNARSLTGKLQIGYIEAKDESEAKMRLRAKQLIPVSLKVVKTEGQKGDLAFLDFILAPSVSMKQLLIFTRQFATLINAGIPIVDGLRILSESTTDKVLKEAIVQIKASVETGRRLSDSMSQHPRAFSAFYVNMIRAGEEAGIIDTILTRLSTYLEKSEKIKNQIKSAMVMPAVILILALAIVSGILVFVVPKFQEIYKSSGKELPAITQSMINFSDSIRNNGFIIAGVIFAVVVSVVGYIKSPEGKKNFDKLIINAPLFGPVVQKAGVAKLSRTMSTLLSSGITMLEAIDIAASTTGNYVLEMALKACKESISVGKPFHLPLARQKEIPPMVAQMVAIGEQTGALDSMLSKVADFYEDEVENSIRAMTSLIEPFLMVTLGSIIAYIMIAMYMPVFQLGDTIG